MCNFSSFLFKNACEKIPCKNNATCQAGFTERDYQCLCTAGFKGHDCDLGKKSPTHVNERIKEQNYNCYKSFFTMIMLS